MIITIVNLSVFLLIIGVLVWMQKKHFSFSKRVFTATGTGVLYGVFLQLLCSKDTILQTLEWTNIAGEGYVRLLQMIVMPLIFISILSAIINMKKGGEGLGKMTGLTLGILMFTAVLAAGIGIITANGFGLSVEGLHMGSSETARGASMVTQLSNIETQSAADRLISLIPTNVFLDFTGSRPTSTIGIVIFTAFLGMAALGMKRKKPASFDFFRNLVVSLHDVVMRLVTLVLRLTPFGILALMAKVVATSSVAEIMNLGLFVLASYVALISMFIVHLLLISFVKINPLTYLKKVLPVLTFAFTSRSSAGTIPLNVETQIDKLGVDEGNANLSASLGATIGQNGCAAIYPAMLAVMIAPTVGIDPTNIEFIFKLIGIIAISSFGVAGVGGGATFAALIVLSSMNLPVALVGLLISVEPLIDMGRTALNVNGAITTGVISSRLLGLFNMKVFNSNKGIAGLNE